jgi:hypothetical protein
MAYTSGELVTRAWFLTGIVSRDIQEVSGSQFEDGMFALNSLLAIQTANMGLISYYDKINFTGIVAQEIYFFPNLIQLETLTFVIPTANIPDQTVRFPMTRLSREEYWATPRANGVQSLPYIYETERVKGGMNVNIYFTPNEAYIFELWGKFSLLSTVPNQDLSTVFDPFYLEYLRYAVACYLCEEYNVIPPPSVNAKLKQYEQQIRNTSPIDFTQKIACPFNGGYAPNYAYANAASGYVPVGWGY